MSTRRAPPTIVYTFKPPPHETEPADLPPKFTILHLAYPFDKGEWIMKHAKNPRNGNVDCGLSWKGARMNVLKDIDIQQEIRVRGRYRGDGGHWNSTDRRATCTSRVDPSLRDGMVTCRMEEGVQNSLDVGRTGWNITYTISFTSLPATPVHAESNYAKAGAKLYFSSFVSVSCSSSESLTARELSRYDRSSAFERR